MMKTLTLAAVAASTLFVAPASAEAPQTVTSNRTAVSRTVGYGDLDLTSTAGQGRFDQRIAVAVRGVCGSASSRDLAELADIRRCRREAAATAANGRELALAANGRRGGVALLTVVDRNMAK